MLQHLMSALWSAQPAPSFDQAARPDIASGVESLYRASPVTEAGDDEDPIFLLSAGWRSGSTLLQRLIMSDSRVLIWGEPYDECGIIQALANTTKPFRADWPPAEYYYDGRPPSDLTSEWIANLFPALENLRSGHRALLDKVFAEPARRAGVPRWGIKEVRLGIEHGFYLRWLYPRARCVFLYLNPLDAYRSYARYGRSWYDTFPDKPIFTPTAFGQHWRRLMQGFVTDAKRLDALLVRYEDLIGTTHRRGDRGAPWRPGESPGVERRSGRLGPQQQASEGNPAGEMVAQRAVSPVAASLGYKW
jgi:hypothetical protein